MSVNLTAAYVLCLKKDPDRYTRFLRTWKETANTPALSPEQVFGMNSDRFPRVPAWRGNNGKDRRGHTCCYWGHVQMWRQALAEQDEYFENGYALFFEDDAAIDAAFFIKLRQAEQELPPDWDILYLGGQHLINGRPGPSDYSETLYKVLYVNRLHAYALRLRALPTILLWFEEHRAWSMNYADPKTGGYEAECDYALASLVEDGILQGYALKHWAASQGMGFSWTQGRTEFPRRWDF